MISSTGKHFSAGMALETFGGEIAMDDRTPEGRAAIFDLLTDMQATFTRLETLRIPVIAAIQGGCIGGAVDMVTACCIRYARPMRFFVSRNHIGRCRCGHLQRLPKMEPMGVVKEWPTRRRLRRKRPGYGLSTKCWRAGRDDRRSVQCAREIAAKRPLPSGVQEVSTTPRPFRGRSLKQMGGSRPMWSNARCASGDGDEGEPRRESLPCHAELVRDF